MGIKLIDKINAEQTAALAGKNFPAFRAGDIVRVSIKIKEGDKFRVQDFEGKVFSVDNGRGGISGNFVVSRDTMGVRVEKRFPFNSPWLQGIKLVKKGTARRAKLYNERTFCSHKAVRKLVKK